MEGFSPPQHCRHLHSSLEPPSSRTRFPPFAPPSRNEQRAISLLLNACHKSPRAPSRSLPPPSLVPNLSPLPPTATLSRIARSLALLLFVFLCLSLFLSRFLPCFTTSPPPKLLRFYNFVSPLFLSLYLSTSLSLSFPRRLNFSLLCFIAFILLRLFFVLSFPPYPASSFAIVSTSNGKKTEKTARGVLVSHFFRHCLKKNNDERERGRAGKISSLASEVASFHFYEPFLPHLAFSLSSRIIFAALLRNFLPRHVLIRSRNRGRSEGKKRIPEDTQAR